MALKRQTLFILALFGVPAIFLVVGLLKAHKIHQVGGLASGQAAPPAYGLQKQRIEKWRNLEFTGLTNGADLHQIVSGFTFQLDEPLNEVEKEDLTNTVMNFITCFKSGTFEDYTKFRIPVKRFSFSRPVDYYLKKKLSFSADDIKKDPESAWKAYWNATINTKFTNYWIGVSVTNCEVKVERSLVGSNDLIYSLTQSSPRFTIDSVHAIAPLAKRIKNPGSDKLSRYLTNTLSASTVDLLSRYGGSESDFASCKQAVFNDLDALTTQGKSIYDADLFAGVKLSPRTTELLKQNPQQGPALIELNRWLLADAFPTVIGAYSLVENAGFSGRTPLLELEPSREFVFKAYGYVKLATIRVICKPRDNYPVFPVYVRLYWSPEDKKWIPSQLIAAYSRPDRVFDLVF